MNVGRQKEEGNKTTKTATKLSTLANIQLKCVIM
jgi:hypothetical protein